MDTYTGMVDKDTNSKFNPSSLSLRHRMTQCVALISEGCAEPMKASGYGVRRVVSRCWAVFSLSCKAKPNRTHQKMYPEPFIGLTLPDPSITRQYPRNPAYFQTHETN